MIRSTEIVLWLNTLTSFLEIRSTYKAKFSKKAIKLYHALTYEGLFPELIMVREFKSGLVHLAKIQ